MHFFKQKSFINFILSMLFSKKKKKKFGKYSNQILFYENGQPRAIAQKSGNGHCFARKNVNNRFARAAHFARKFARACPGSTFISGPLPARCPFPIPIKNLGF